MSLLSFIQSKAAISRPWARHWIFTSQGILSVGFVDTPAFPPPSLLLHHCQSQLASPPSYTSCAFQELKSVKRQQHCQIFNDHMFHVLKLGSGSHFFPRCTIVIIWFPNRCFRNKHNTHKNNALSLFLLKLQTFEFADWSYCCRNSSEGQFWRIQSYKLPNWFALNLFKQTA